MAIVPRGSLEPGPLWRCAWICPGGVPFRTRPLFATGFPDGLPYNMFRGKGAAALTVVYVDSVFVLNALMDYLLVLSAARLAGIPLRRGRYLLAGLLGGAYAVAVFLPGLGFLAATPVKLAAGVLLALTAYGGEEKLLRLTLLLFAVSCALAGCVLALGLLAGGGVPVVNGVFYTDVDAKVLLIASAAAYLVLTVVFRAAAGKGIRGQLVPVRVCLGGRETAFTAFCDTGNCLRDPVSGQPVLVVSPGRLDGALPRQVRQLLSSPALERPAELLEPLLRAAPDLRFRLIPYHAVGVDGGLLLAVRSDWTEVAGERYAGLPVALSPTDLGTGYSALWGGAAGRRRPHEKLEGTVAAAAGADRPAAAGRSALHRRQRHAAPAPEPGAGGSAAGADRGRGRPEGAHRT